MRTRRRRGLARQNTSTKQVVPQVDLLRAAGVKQLSDGTLQISPEAYGRLFDDRRRRASVHQVPVTPRYTTGGIGDATTKTQYGYDHASFEMLRETRQRIPLLGMIHAARARQVERFSMLWSGRRGDVGMRIVHQSHFEDGVEAPKGIEPFIQASKDMLSRPCPSKGFDALSSLTVPLVEDHLTINRMAIEVLSSSADPARVVGLRPVDGGMFLEPMSYVNHWMNQNVGRDGALTLGQSEQDPRRVLDMISESLDDDIRNVEYIMIRDGLPEAVYAPGKIIIRSQKRRTDIRFGPYQPSHVEEAIELTAAYWETWDRENRVFREGMWSNSMLLVTGALDAREYELFLQRFREASQGYKRSTKPIIMRNLAEADIKKIDLKDPPSDLEQQNRFAMVTAGVCAHYQMHPSAIFHKLWGAGQGNALQERNQEQEIIGANFAGHQQDLAAVCEHLTTFVQRHIHPELVVTMEYGVLDPLREAQINTEKVKTDCDRNEIRISQNRRPRAFYLDPDEYESASEDDKKKHDLNPWNMPDSQTFEKAAQTAWNPKALTPPPSQGGLGTTPAPTTAQRGAQRSATGEAVDRAPSGEKLAKGLREVTFDDVLDNWSNY